ncbi:Epoxide hydrolase [Mycena sanguinolenta]|uniref:Epoxide hydrolase n=1 Tax=Mycena sanguinolenta TaxID=230812 RepID=A0A8H6XZT6_9AGAR|nr:Epoxide hydrolase [Mycena sanguinolenta]
MVEMDRNNYKQTKTKRGFTYSYFYSAPASGKPVLFFAHGFPSASFLWRKQVAFFQPLGYGIIVPDQLGYGGTDKPTDPKLYVGRGLAEDMRDILDAEAVATVVAIGHDWGSYLVSRMLHYIPLRISAVALCDVGYRPAEPGVNSISQKEALIKMIGYDAFAYQRFFIQPDAAAIIEKNIDSFISMIYPEKPESWKENMCVDGGAREWIENNTITASPSYLIPEDKEAIKTSLLSGGLAGPLCWYTQQLEQANIDEDAKLPTAAREFTHPLLFIACTKDCVALPIFGDSSHGKYAKGPVTRKEIEADHWGPMSHAAEVNEMVLEWLGTLG